MEDDKGLIKQKRWKKYIIIAGMISISGVSVIYAETVELILYKQSLKKISLKSASLPTSIKIIKKKKITFVLPQTEKTRWFKQSKEKIEVLSISTSLSSEEVVNMFNQLPQVRHAEINEPLELYTRSADPLSQQQTYLDFEKLYKVWALEENSKVIVAIIDTGMDVDHIELSQGLYINIKEKKNGRDNDNNGIVDDVHGATWIDWINQGTGADPDDDHGHGTHIAGIIGARHNGIGITGIHPNAIIMPLKIFNKDGKGKQLEAALAIRYAVDHGADMINCSWGFITKTKILQEAVEYALNQGVIVISAVGNYSSKVTTYPSGFSGVIGVGTVGKDKHREWFSNYGDSVDFVTIGSNILSTLPGDKYGELTGTSQSAAIITGLIARLKSYQPKLDPQNMYSLLRQSSSSPINKKSISGHGIPNALALLAEFNIEDIETMGEEKTVFSTEDTRTSNIIQSVLNAPNPVKEETIDIYFESNKAGIDIDIKLYNMEGIELISQTDKTLLGNNKITIDASTLNNGPYIYVIIVPQTHEVHKEICVILR